jgi:hypothetical protein
MLPVAAEALITKPGKFANMEKLRQEIGKTTSGQTEDEQRAGMTEATQRGYPVVIGNKAIGLGLSQTLLNNLPRGVTPHDLSEFQSEFGRLTGGLTHPVIRAVYEWKFGRNMITKAELERPDRPLTAAPAWVSKVPKKYWAQLDITPPKGKGEGGSGYTDTKTGRPAWAWRGKADWGYDQLMLGLIGQGAAIGGSGRSQTTTPQALAALTGVRVDPLNKVAQEKAKQQSTRPERDRIKRRLGVLNQSSITSDNATGEYKRLRKRLNELEPRATTKKAKPNAGSLSGFKGGGGGSSGGGGGSLAGYR